MGFKKYYVTKAISEPSLKDEYGHNCIKVESVSDFEDYAEDFLFSDDHNLEDVVVGYWYLS